MRWTMIEEGVSIDPLNNKNFHWSGWAVASCPAVSLSPPRHAIVISCEWS